MIVSSKSKVFFLNEGIKLRVPQKKRLKEFILLIFKTENQNLDSINYIFSSDSYLLKINRNFLNHNTFTDVITFQLSDYDHPIISDVYISLERVKENSQILKTRLNEELHRVIFHGALHLCGYEDKTKRQKAIMQLRENHYLSKYFQKRFT